MKMSIQTTRDITRQEAESRFVELEFKARFKRMLELVARTMTDDELEEVLEEQFYNYQITEDVSN